MGAGVILASLWGALPARAQYLPSEPIAIADGRVTIGGDVSASIGSQDPGFFNYTDYEHSALRLLRIDVAGSVKAGEHLALLGELQTENFNTLRPYALYLRIRPWRTRALDIQVGRIPPTFGAFARRTYVSANPLIGYPLAYQYLTTLRPDALPATTDELLLKRSTGWLVRYTVGAATPDRGVPLVSAFRWDTGVQVHTSNDFVSATAAVTTGTVSNPLFRDDNGGRQVAGRVEFRPVAGLVAGSSFARGPFVTDSAARSVSETAQGATFTQTAWGGDAEYSRSHYIVRAETIVSAWRVPFRQQPALTGALRAYSTSIEGRYTIAPGFYAAARGDRIDFSEIRGTQGELPWDAPVSRIEVGVGYSIQRNLLLKGSVQRNQRNGGRLRQQDTLGAAQVVFWF